MDIPHSTFEPMQADQHAVIKTVVETTDAAKETNTRTYKFINLLDEN
jgi:hypothetical protein